MAFKPGQSGNPAGKPKGCLNKRLELFRSSDKKLQRKVLKMALDGDVAMLKIVADRLWPRLRTEAMPVIVKTKSADIASQGAAIINAALAGKLTPDVLRDLLGALADQARLVEFSEIESRPCRVTALDVALAPRPPTDRNVTGKLSDPLATACRAACSKTA